MRKEGSVMGRSRSASFIIAYLLFSDDSLDVSSALALLNQCRACVQPNSGFMLQLGLYFSMGCPVELDKEAAYYRWLERRGGGRKSGSWEDMRGKISARARKMDEERKLLEERDGMQTEVQLEGGVGGKGWMRCGLRRKGDEARWWSERVKCERRRITR